MMKILTIIVSYNFEKWISRCLNSLKASSHPNPFLCFYCCHERHEAWCMTACGTALAAVSGFCRNIVGKGAYGVVKHRHFTFL